MDRNRVMQALRGERDGQPVYGSGTSIVCGELMHAVGVFFPEAHQDADKMATLAEAGHSVLGLDMVMPLFSVCHEAAAMGCRVNWGGPEQMPESGPAILRVSEDVTVPPDLLQHPACRVPLEAIRLLRRRLGDATAVCGKVFGPWTQAYHYYGIESFLMLTLDDPDRVRQIIDCLLPVTLSFARAQIDAGADCILLGDHATRDLCSPKAYREFLLPIHARLAEEIPAPVILHICGQTEDRIQMIAETGLACFHWDTCTGTAGHVRALAGDRIALMGGVSNYTLLRGTPDEVAAMALEATSTGIDIVGPECAVPLSTPLANLQAIARARS